MNKLVVSLNIFVFVQHAFFFVLEALLWKSPIGRKIFRTTEVQAEQTSALAINQGFYNLFFAFGFLICAISGLNFDLGLHQPTLHIFNMYLALSIVSAAIVGGITVSRRILLIQGIPSLVLALILLTLIRS